MGLDRVYTNPYGVRMIIKEDVLGIAARVSQGEPLVGWTGDDRMFVRFNQLTKRYEVWRLGEDNKERIISSWAPEEFDQRVLIALAKGDTRYHDVLAEIDEHNRKVEEKRAEENRELEMQMKEILARGLQGEYTSGVDTVGIAGKSRDVNAPKKREK